MMKITLREPNYCNPVAVEVELLKLDAAFNGARLRLRSGSNGNLSAQIEEIFLGKKKGVALAAKIGISKQLLTYKKACWLRGIADGMSEELNVPIPVEALSPYLKALRKRFKKYGNV